MKVLLMRHGHRGAKGLSVKGEETVKKNAAILKEKNLVLKQIRHSSPLRAKKTAELMAEQLKPPQIDVIQVKGIEEYDEAHDLVDIIEHEQDTVMYVSHQPFLEDLVPELLNDKPDVLEYAFSPGDIVCLSQENGKWRVDWRITSNKFQ